MTDCCALKALQWEQRLNCPVRSQTTHTFMRFKNEKAGFIFFFPKWQILRYIEGSEDGAGIQKIQNKELPWRMGEGTGFPWGSQEGGEGGRQAEALCPALSLLLLGGEESRC